MRDRLRQFLCKKRGKTVLGMTNTVAATPRRFGTVAVVRVLYQSTVPKIKIPPLNVVPQIVRTAQKKHPMVENIKF